MERREKLSQQLREEIDRIDAMDVSLQRMMQQHGGNEIRFWRHVKAEFGIPVDQRVTITPDHTEIIWQEQE